MVGMPHFVMGRYKFDVGKVVCVIGHDGKDGKNEFYIKPQGSISQDGSSILKVDTGNGNAFSMMLGIAIGERTGGDPRSLMMSILGLGVMLDHHIANVDDSDLIDHLRDPDMSGRDGFCTISEFIPFKKVGDPYSLEAYLQINDEEHLLMSTRDMQIKIEDALQSISENITLFPGDIVGIWLDGIDRPVKPGDLIEGGISSISTVSVQMDEHEDGSEDP